VKFLVVFSVFGWAVAACEVTPQDATNFTTILPITDAGLGRIVESPEGGVGANYKPADGGAGDTAAEMDPALLGDIPGPAIEGACDVELGEVALYQAVKITLGDDGVTKTSLSTDVIAKRPALVRAFVKPGPGWINREAMVRLALRSSTSVHTYYDRKVIGEASTDADLNSTFNFEVPGTAIAENLTYVVDIVGPTSCMREPASTRLPAKSVGVLKARNSGVLKVRLVPVRYDADGSGRMPDVSPKQVAIYRDYLMSLYPVQRVDVTVRSTVGTSDRLTATAGWSELLDAIRDLRSQDRQPSDVYYYGLVNPADSFAAYCKQSCIGGIAFNAPANGAMYRSGVGLGFSGSSTTTEAMAHEIGHEHGRGHSPCGTTNGTEPDYPVAEGGIGAWGYDLISKVLYSPLERKDLMGYCKPRWISDYTYQQLAVRSSLINVTSSTRALLADTSGPTNWRVLMLGPGGVPRWGLPATLAAGEAPPVEGRERAEILDKNGQFITSVEAYRTPVGDAGESTLLVPEPQAGWHSIKVAGAIPHPFAAPTRVSRLAP
jgi:hypothetical protein